MVHFPVSVIGSIAAHCMPIAKSVSAASNDTKLQLTPLETQSVVQEVTASH